MEMREKIARAVAETKRNGTSLRSLTEIAAHQALVRWDEDKFQQSMLTLADAVLDTLRKPTEAMVEAAAAKVSDFDPENGQTAPETAALAWQAAIDAARNGA